MAKFHRLLSSLLNRKKKHCSLFLQIYGLHYNYLSFQREISVPSLQLQFQLLHKNAKEERFHNHSLSRLKSGKEIVLAFIAQLINTYHHFLLYQFNPGSLYFEKGLHSTLLLERKRNLGHYSQIKLPLSSMLGPGRQT